MLVYFMDIWSIFRPFDIFYGHLRYFVVIRRYIFPRVGKLNQEKSGNPGQSSPFFQVAEKKLASQVVKGGLRGSLRNFFRVGGIEKVRRVGKKGGHNTTMFFS
jgi:hypothetical protein